MEEFYLRAKFFAINANGLWFIESFHDKCRDEAAIVVENYSDIDRLSIPEGLKVEKYENGEYSLYDLLSSQFIMIIEKKRIGEYFSRA